MFDRIRASFALAISSWRVLLNNKHLLVFPFLSGISCLLVLASFLTPLIVFRNHLDHNEWVLFVAGFAFYFCTYFVIIFFNAALVSCALKSFRGETPTLADGMSAAWSRLPQIFGWAMVSATVGMLLRGIESIHEQAGRWVSAILGSIWTLMTYFVVPVIVVEELGPFDALKRSMSIINKTWGEALVGRLGLGLFLFLMLLPGVAILIVGIVVVQTIPVLGTIFIVSGVLYLLVDLAVSAALDSIFITALYKFAADDEIPVGFDREMMRHAVRTR